MAIVSMKLYVEYCIVSNKEQKMIGDSLLLFVFALVGLLCVGDLANNYRSNMNNLIQQDISVFFASDEVA